MDEMYNAIAGSPITYLTGDISAGQTTIAVADDSALPDAPNICTIGYGENIETIRYGAKSNGVLQEVTRGIEGTPRAWQSGTEVARFFTAYDHNAIVETITTHLADSVPVKLTLLNGWTGDLYVRKLGHGLVQIYGDITPGVTDRATVIATLPEGYLVPYFTQIPAHSGVVATGGILGFVISATGNFSIYNPAASANLGTSYIRFNHIYKTI